MKKTYYGALVWFLATLFVVYSFCLNTAAAVFSEAIRNSLGLSSLGVTIALAAFIAGFALMQIPAGYLLDRYNPRWVVASGVFVLAVGNIIISYADNLLFFTVSNFIQGIGASFAFIAAGVLISQWFPQKLFPVLFGLTQTFSCVLAGLIHYLFMVALKTHTWNELYKSLAILGFVLSIVIVTLVKSPKDMQRGPALSLKKSLGILIKNPQIWLCSLAAAASFGVLLAYASFWYLKIQEFYDVISVQSMIISGMIFVGIGVGTPLLGWLSNALKSRKLVLHLSLVLGTMVLLLGIYLPHYNIQTLIIIKIISLLIGLFLSGSMLFYTVVSEISTDQTRGVALSVTNTSVFLFNTIIMFIPQLFITQISTTFFTYLWVLPFFTMVSLLLLYFVRESYQNN